MKIGYSNGDYLNRRNIINVVADAQYIKSYNINRYIHLLARGLLRPNAIDIATSFTDLGLHGVDLMHFFNTISFGTTPWITTFETIVPRFRSTLTCHHGRNCDYSSLTHEPKVAKALDALSDDSCKSLIAMSECNLGMQIDFLRHFPDHQAAIKNKLTYLHPPQELLVDDFESKGIDLEGEIRFIFVGSSFFRKGGIDLLESFKEARRNNNYDLKLTIVSSLSIDDYATKETKEDVNKAKKIIYENREWVEYSRYLGNQQVLELMRGSHIGLLPTYADTYGFSVLEFQAAGCPVVSTNARALPEINNNETGWVIEIPKNRLGEAIFTTEEDRAAISSAIKKGLTRAIAEIMDNRQVIYRKANASIERIQANHSPKDFSGKIGEIYRRALEGDIAS